MLVIWTLSDLCLFLLLCLNAAVHLGGCSAYLHTLRQIVGWQKCVISLSLMQYAYVQNMVQKFSSHTVVQQHATLQCNRHQKQKPCCMQCVVHCTLHMLLYMSAGLTGPQRQILFYMYFIQAGNEYRCSCTCCCRYSTMFACLIGLIQSRHCRGLLVATPSAYRLVVSTA